MTIAIRTTLMTKVRAPNLGRFLIWDKAIFQGTLSCISTVYTAHIHSTTYGTHTLNVLPGRILETPSLTSKCCDVLIIIDIHNIVVIIILKHILLSCDVCYWLVSYCRTIRESPILFSSPATNCQLQKHGGVPN